MVVLTWNTSLMKLMSKLSGMPTAYLHLAINFAASCMLLLRKSRLIPDGDFDSSSSEDERSHST